MAVKIDSIGHCAMAASDIDAISSFYCDVLGFEVLERDPDHGGVFLRLDGTSHAFDIFPMFTTGTRPAASGSPLVHIAFKVSSYAALREADATLLAHEVRVKALIDHTNQRSIYFDDPEGNRLEIYFEKPDWADIFRAGRGDEDRSFNFDEPSAGWD